MSFFPVFTGGIGAGSAETGAGIGIDVDGEGAGLLFLTSVAGVTTGGDRFGKAVNFPLGLPSQLGELVAVPSCVDRHLQHFLSVIDHGFP